MAENAKPWDKKGKGKEKRRELTALADLKPAPYNEEIRDITPQAADALGFSLERFGDLSGITWNQRTGCLVAGHQRVAELRKRGVKLEGNALVIPETDERFAIRIVDWSLEDEKEASLAANHAALTGTFTDHVADVAAEVQETIDSLEFNRLHLDELLAEEPGEPDLDLKEWDASELTLQALFTFSAPVELQPKIRALLEKEFPGVEFEEEIVHA